LLLNPHRVLVADSVSQTTAQDAKELKWLSDALVQWQTERKQIEEKVALRSERFAANLPCVASIAAQKHAGPTFVVEEPGGALHHVHLYAFGLVCFTN
jgi:hypothetical protein